MGFIVDAVSSVVNAVVGVVRGVIGIVSKVVGGVFGFIVGGKPKISEPVNTLNKSLEPEAYRKILLGRTAAPLDVRHWQVWGSSGTRFDEVIALATHRINSVQEIYFEDKLAFNAAGVVQSPFNGVVSREVRLGLPGQTALNVGGGNQYTAQATFDGCAALALKWLPDEKKLPNGVPSRYTVVSEGGPVYDPRRDSTVPGGLGPHRINDRSTWEYATLDGNGVPIGRNNALQALWYLLGWTIPTKDEAGNVTGEMLVAGRGVIPEDINLATFIAGANACEVAGYYTDVALSTGDDHTTNEAKITCDGLIGRLIDPGGLWSYYANVDDTANIAVELTDADILENVAFNWDEFKGMSEQYNQIGGKFVNPSNITLFQAFPYPLVRDAVYENALGKKVRKTQDFEQVLDGVLAQRLARLKLNEGQYQGELSAGFMARAIKAQAWSVVRYTSERWGFTKLFRVWRHDISTDGGVGMLLKEIHPSIWGAGTVTPVAAPGAGLGYDPRQEIPIVGLNVAQYPVIAPDGTKGDGFIINWVAPAENVRRTEIRYKLAGTTFWETAGPVDRDVIEVVVAPLYSGAIYTAEARHISIHEIPGPWVSVGNFQLGTTGNVNFAAIEAAGGTANWSEISDDNGNMPEDNATVGAPTGTPVDDRTAENVTDTIDSHTGSIGSVTTTVNNLLAGAPIGVTLQSILVDVDALETTYGDTASASASASAAAGAASAAQLARDSARKAAVQMLPSDFAEDGRYFGHAFEGQDVGVAYPASNIWSFGNTDPPKGKVAYCNVTPAQLYVDLAQAGFVKLQAGRKYRVTIDARYTQIDATNTLIAYLIFLNASFSYLSNKSTNFGYTAAMQNQWKTLVVEATAEEIWAISPTAVYVRGMARAYASVGAGTKTVQVSSINFEDITESNAAGTYAFNASGSASNASASASAAATSATTAAAYSTPRGLTPNGDFEQGPSLWDGGTGNQPMSWAARGSYGATWRSSTSFAGSIVFTGKIPVDPTRKYKLKTKFIVHGSAQSQYAGFSAYDANNNHIGNIYMLSVANHTFPGSSFQEKEEIITGIMSPAPSVPVYTAASAFPPNTAYVKPLFLANYTAAANSFTDVQELYLEDITESQAAASSASIASGSAATASAASASALASATLAASIGQRSLVTNPTFAVWPEPVGETPTGWSEYGSAGVLSRVTGFAPQPYAHRHVSTPGAVCGSSTQGDIGQFPKGKYVLEWELTLNSGTLARTGLLLQWYNSASAYLQGTYILASHYDVNGVLVGAGIPGRTYRYTRLIDVSDDGASLYNLYIMTDGYFLPSTDVVDVTHRLASVRPATEEEIRSNSIIPSLQATVSSQSGVIANLQGRALAYFQQEVNAGIGNGAAAFFAMRAESSWGAGVTSNVSIGANEIHLYNTSVAGFAKALSVAAGRVTVFGDLDALGAMRFGSRRIPVALQSFIVSGSDGSNIDFGGDLVNMPKIEFDRANLPVLSGGQQYDIKALNLTPSGFTLYAKIITPSSPGSQSQGPGTNVGGTPSHRMHKASATDSATGYYSFTVTAQKNFIAPPGEIAEGFLNVDVYVRPAVTGVWTKIGTMSVYVQGSNFGSETLSESWTESFYFADALGQSGDYEFGVSGVYLTTVTSFNIVSYPTQGTSGSTTAVPQTVTARIVPQNA